MLVVSAEAFSLALPISPERRTPLISLSVPQDTLVNIRVNVARKFIIHVPAPHLRNLGCYFYNLTRQFKTDELLTAEHRNLSGNQLSRDFFITETFHPSDRYDPSDSDLIKRVSHSFASRYQYQDITVARREDGQSVGILFLQGVHPTLVQRS